jgi:hypothetical protein
VISIGWGTIALFVAILAFFYVLAGVGIVLPLVAIGLWRTGRRAPAVKLGLAGSVALVLSAGPHLWDRIAFGRSVAALEKVSDQFRRHDLAVAVNPAEVRVHDRLKASRPWNQLIVTC